MNVTVSGRRRLFARKSVEELQRNAASHGLKRSLGPLNLVLLGVGCILGAGIYVMPGNAAAHFAGPAVILSFILSGTACAFTALCYAELASTMPVSGSSYTYCYATMGEVCAWGLGWLLLFDYGLAAALLAVGLSSYFVSLAHSLGVVIPANMATPLVQAASDGSGLVANGGVNLVAALAIAIATVVLVLGVSLSAKVNNILVFIKIAVLVAVVAVGIGAIDPHNWSPFVPPNEGGFAYGWPGIMRGASILFFAYIGFETVSTAAAEARNPQKDMPIGIVGSLAVCTILYIVVAAVMTGIVPYRELGVADPIAVTVDRMGHPGFAVLAKLGALVGLSSVLLVNAYGQSRISFAMSNDGLLPPLFGRIHPRYQTPYLGTILFGAISAIGAAMLPLSLLGDLTSLGAGLAFSVVCIGVMWLRSTRPELSRPFRVPLGGIHIGKVWIGTVPVAGVILCWTMVAPVAIDIVSQARAGHYVPATILGVYALAGVLFYFGYSRQHSHLNRLASATSQ